MNKNSLRKNRKMFGALHKKHGFICWRHVFTGFNIKTGLQKSFFIEFFIINPSRSPQEPVFGQLYEQKIKKYFPSYIMIKAGTWGEQAKQIHEFYPVCDLQVDRKTLNLRLNSLVISEEQLQGSVFMSEQNVLLHPEYMSDAGSMSWDLTMQKELASDFKDINWHAQGIKTAYKGRVVYNDEEFIVRPEKSFGYADKFWGKDFTSPLMYLSASNAVSDISSRPLKDTCFAVGCGCSKKKGPRNLPLYAAVFYYEGIRYDFNVTGFAKKSRVTFNFREGAEDLHWLICAETAKYLLDIDIFCRKTDTVFMNYESPEGSKYHNRLWSCGNGTGELKFFQKNGKKLELIESAYIENSFCEYGEYDMMDFI
ncbi:hypothetical protein H0R92_02765 [Treponema sp. OMZ 840]|uniref:hypothetical protein n=1 Tax=Treponema sp. OMZ 840 TaxID=244313 RepID=UPI003D941F76